MTRLKAFGLQMADALKISAAIVGIITTIMTALWFIGRNEARDAVRDFVGVNQIEGRLTEQRTVIESGFNEATIERIAINDRVSAVEGQIALIKPKAVIAEYDERRSKVLSGACIIGEQCKYRFRVRRTSHGKTCRTPVSTPIVLDADGDRHYAQTTGKQARRLSTDWTIVEGSFTTPDTVPSGEAEFFFDMEYDCPAEPGIGETHYEESFRLAFVVRKPNTH